MSLNATLDVNGRVVGRITMRRVTNTTKVRLDADTVSQYEVQKYDDQGRHTVTTDVWHRFGDGAEKLLLIALEATVRP